MHLLDDPESDGSVPAINTKMVFATNIFADEEEERKEEVSFNKSLARKGVPPEKWFWSFYDFCRNASNDDTIFRLKSEGGEEFEVDISRFKDIFGKKK